MRFCFLMTLEVGSELEADSEIIVVAQQIIWVLQSLMNLRCYIGRHHGGIRNLQPAHVFFPTT